MPRFLLIAGLLAALYAMGCKRVVPPGGAPGSKPEAARKQAESLAADAVTRAAEEQARAIPSLARKRGLGGLIDKVTIETVDAVNRVTHHVQHAGPNPNSPGKPSVPAEGIIVMAEPLEPKALPRPGPAPIIKERISSSLPYPNVSDAQKDAINAACDLVQQRLAELDPPVRYRPTPNELENEFLRRDSRAVRQPDQAEKEFFAKNGITGNLVYVEYDVEVTANQVRALRTHDRVAGTLRVFGALAAISLAGFLFLRADEWTKGYLTRWLAVVAVLFAGGAAAALYLV